MNEKIALYSTPLSTSKYNSYLDMVDAAVEFGIKYIETINFFELKQPDVEFAKKLREYADSKGVKFVCTSVGIDLVNDGNEKNIDIVKGFADVAKILGSPYLHHTVALNVTDPDRTENNKELYFSRGVKAIEEIYDYCESIGIKAVYEDQGYLFNGVEGFKKLMNATDRNFGVVVDFGNILFVDEPIENFIPLVKDRVVNVHIKDYIFTDGKTRDKSDAEFLTVNKNYLLDCEFGKGIVNFDKAFEELRKIGYNGYYAIENVALGEDERKTYINNIEYLSKYL